MENEKTSRRPGRAISIFIVVTLGVNVVLTGINAYFTVQFNRNLTPLGFRSSMSNSTFFMVARAYDSNLGKPAAYFSQEGVIEQTVHYGILFVAVQVVTPHYGALTIGLKDYYATESEYLSSERRSEREVSFADEKESHVHILIPGLNQISVRARQMRDKNLPVESAGTQIKEVSSSLRIGRFVEMHLWLMRHGFRDYIIVTAASQRQLEASC